MNIATILSPIAGAINFCPDQFQARSDEDNIRIGIHEVIHALVRATYFTSWTLSLFWVNYVQYMKLFMHR